MNVGSRRYAFTVDEECVDLAGALLGDNQDSACWVERYLSRRGHAAKGLDRARYCRELAIVEMIACNVASALGSTRIECVDDASVNRYADGHRALRASPVSECQAFVIDAEDGNVIAASVYHDQPLTVFAED